ncbi:PREDICTED: synaptic vesicle glycoprotein 2B-like [Nicrophorus vespilloides]|uniref:Synaptic vesicle glycoprotein 2B-like n=1 Tax=Nicrophorus vespilloides TaxID=110193 RepID=A0ABM1MD52_NICVS|nr:PREDICTED: synaptic vesicle glycoprotein 2B-like [Nicrophorus vespilloides]
MCEESACLVPPLEAAQNGQTEPRMLTSGSGSGGSVAGEALVGFHEDALAQAHVGKAQLLLTIILGLAVAAECSEFAILGYILPASELQLCIDDHRKGWLVSITLLALAIGSVGWGILGDRMGRRRALVSALSVAALFSAVATVMPTYGTFMTARFCSGIGVAGAMPLTFSYLAETCPRSTRTRYTGLLHSFWPMGALLTSSIAHLTLPSDGAEVVLDNREHWSSWHRFLILNILPAIACIIGLIWTSESPRYLLEASREVEALEVYQRLHRLNKSRTQYGLTELELPGRAAYRDRPASPSRNVLRHGFDTVCEAFQRICSPVHLKTTSLLATLHLLLGFIYMGVSSYSAAMIKDINNVEYNSMRRTVINVNYTGTNFNHTIENVQYIGTFFKNVSFKHLEFQHVEFLDCIFEEAEFTNVKSSITYFVNTTIKNSRFVDTDLSDRHFINCNMINNTILSLKDDCAVDFDYNIYFEDLCKETVAWAGPMVPALLIIGTILEIGQRPTIIAILLTLTSLTTIGIFFLYNLTSVLIVEVIIKVLLICAINATNIVVIEAYPCHLRCTAHGIMRSLFHLASLASIPIYNLFVHSILLIPAAVTMAISFSTAVLSTRIQDNSKVLL